MPRLTIKDLARLAGVASSTISRALNDLPGVSPEMRARIKRLAEETGFTPSARARSFVTGNAGAIGMLIPRSNEYVFSNPFYLDIMRGAADAAAQAEMNLLLITADKGSYSHLYQEQRVDGLVFASTRLDDPGLMKLADAHYPFVLIGRSNLSVPMNQIEIDDVTAAREATEYLIGLGHRRIAFAGGPISVPSGYDRFEGYRQALGRHDIAYDEHLAAFRDPPLPTAGAEMAREILAKKPGVTAFFAFNDLVAIGAIEELRAAGLAPGVNVSVLGFDDIFAARYANPPLTTIRQSGYDKGRLAVERLHQMLTGETEPRRIPLPTQLIVRQSTHRLG